MAEVEILLATYNGARFLPELLASLDAQTDQNWRILVRDDGSSDETAAIVQAWGEGLGERFRRIEDDRGNLGAVGNFNALLEASTARYFLPCDQDDVWLPDKIARLTRAIRDEEGKMGANRPIIVHTDLIVVDEELNVLSESFWDYQKIRMLPEKDPWKLITLQNTVTGCAMIGNRALLDRALPVPEDAMVHDWWLALACALMGRIRRLDGPSVRYRQHGTNTLGAQEWSVLLAMKLALAAPRLAIVRPRSILDETQAQAGAALRDLGGSLPQDRAAFLRDYAHLRNARLLQRKAFALHHRLFYVGWLRNIALMLSL